MGIIGLLVTVLIMILGAGYFLLGSSNGPITVENPAVKEQGTMNSEQGAENSEQGTMNSEQGAENSEQGTMNSEQGAGSIASFEAIKNQAEGVKDMVEKRSEETMEQGAGNSEHGAGNKQQTAVVPLSSGASAVGKEKTDLNIIDRKVDFGFGVSKEKRTIDTVVLHSSYNSTGGDPYSVEKVIDIWKGYEVAPHYIIDRKGNIYRLVDDADIAYHAGVSKLPDGRTNVNDFSIGIEILNTKEDKYTEAEYDAVNTLIAYLRGKYSIKQVVGHADIAPGRKDDPWNFNWKQLK